MPLGHSINEETAMPHPFLSYRDGLHVVQSDAPGIDCLQIH
jgi:hypothetical protein